MKKFFLLSLLFTGCNLLNPNGVQNTVTNGLDTKKYPFRIVEVLPNPDGTDIGNEYFKVKNIGSESADISNWYSTGRISLRRTHIRTVKVAPNEEVFLGRGGTNEWLHNTADTLRFYAPDNTLVQTIIWANAKDGDIIKP